MAYLLSIPENVMIQQLFPYLNHNDLLRLRRVSKQTKALAEAYLWTPHPGHQGKWELDICTSEENHTFQAFLQLGLPPPSRLHIANYRAEKAPSERNLFFEDEHMDEFLERYGKYVTELRVDKLFLPFTSAKEIGFYESLINLKKLHCFEMITVGGSAQFEEKTTNAKGSFLIRPTLKKLTVFQLYYTDCMDSMWNFVNGISYNLEELLHPFQRGNGDVARAVISRTNFAIVKQLIERRGMKSKLLYDWRYLQPGIIPPLELLRVFASCFDNGVMIQNLSASCLDCLLCDENGRIAEIDEVVDPISHEWICNPAVNYHRNLFVGNVIHSLEGVTDNVFPMEMPALENIRISRRDSFQIYRRRGVGYSQWPNLRKMDVRLSKVSPAQFRFIWTEVQRPKLEELKLSFGYTSGMLKGIPECRVPSPRDLGNFGNLKKLTIIGNVDNIFLVALWEGLPRLEDVTLSSCWKLTNEGFVGNEVAGRKQGFLKLEKLKHLTILNLNSMPGITDTTFKRVFRHLKLSSFKLSSCTAISSITIAGIRKLLTGPFTQTIQKLEFNQLILENASEKELKEVVSRFRCSKML